MKGKFGLVGLFTICFATAISALTGNAKADGNIVIYNNVYPSANYCVARHLSEPGVSEGYDGEPIDFEAPIDLYIDGDAGLYSEIPGYKLIYDARPNDSNTDFNLKLVYKGYLSTPQANYLEVNFYVPPEPAFDNKPVILELERLPYGSVVDVRRAIAKNGGVVPLIDLPAGTYSTITPYGFMTLTIGTRLLGDLDDSNRVTFKDFAILNQGWEQLQGQYTGDIAGPNGIPDGYVNNYDLSAFSEDWLKDVNDSNTW